MTDIPTLRLVGRDGLPIDDPPTPAGPAQAQAGPIPVLFRAAVEARSAVEDLHRRLSAVEARPDPPPPATFEVYCLAS